MIELPAYPAPNSFEFELLDFGYFQRPQTGAPALRINRPGSRFKAIFGFAPMLPEVARPFYARLTRARNEGLRIEIPLLENQGVPGSPVVGASGQSGSSLYIAGFRSGYLVKEGFWFTITRASTGVKSLHMSLTTTRTTGSATIEIEPALRTPFLAGDQIDFVKPTIEGFIIESSNWNLSPDRLIRFGATFSVEEAE